jgi:hypothetical protein
MIGCHRAGMTAAPFDKRQPSREAGVDSLGRDPSRAVPPSAHFLLLIRARKFVFTGILLPAGVARNVGGIVLDCGAD